ncbi:hypothetical protein POM88_039444 [Heracleum sosnowskyi]|uniref:ATP-dependent DNA ligase family profile domain-containing protein n=1 Tax=Heracleum sosnowskyi TaxID=360622 RepID=A0AAD8HCS8_9APIA|nr:hypothetical protein POM88_039444 [Heracleum sosnowskyi]
MVQARLREAAFLEKHVLLKNLRDALESLRGRVVGRNKDDVEEAISISFDSKRGRADSGEDGSEEAGEFSEAGIMVKSLDVEAGYTPSKRSDSWLKVKRDYVESLNDSLDLVLVGAWHGNGRKAGW